MFKRIQMVFSYLVKGMVLKKSSILYENFKKLTFNNFKKNVSAFLIFFGSFVYIFSITKGFLIYFICFSLLCVFI